MSMIPQGPSARSAVTSAHVAAMLGGAPRRPPRMLAFGPESSGTRWLRWLLEAGGAYVTHRSQPNGITWVDARAMVDDYDHVVVIVRGALAHTSSMAARSIVDAAGAWDHRQRQLAGIAPILGHPKVTLVTFESLAARDERRFLLEHLGLDPAGADAVGYDPNANAQHYRSDPDAPPARTIPHRLIRVIPERVSDEVEGWWAEFAGLHPRWELRTIQDPIDPLDWPLLGHLHRLCTSGAQLAGLVRLEALHRWGGWYVDSDVEPVRALDPLCGTKVVVGLEDDRHTPDAVVGAPTHHPAIRAVIDHVSAIFTGDRNPGPQATGPLATTEVLAGRPDVTVMPREAFYPCHYTEDPRPRSDFAGDPNVFLIHRWHHSWNGT